MSVKRKNSENGVPETTQKKQKSNDSAKLGGTESCYASSGSAGEFKRKNCMKHKKKDKNFEKKKFKKHRKQKKKDKSSPDEEKNKAIKTKQADKPRERIKLPTEPNEISANWKQLLAQV